MGPTPAGTLGHNPSNSTLGHKSSMNQSTVSIIQEDVADVDTWTVDQVLSWLEERGFSDYAESFRAQRVDGKVLVYMTHEFLSEKIHMSNTLHRKKLLRLIEALYGSVSTARKERLLDDMDEYVTMLDTQRIGLVAKLKSIFDTFVPVPVPPPFVPFPLCCVIP